jgi:hypothetical protein
MEGLHLVGEFLQLIKDKYFELCFDHMFWHDCAGYHVSFFPLCVKEVAAEYYGLV